MISRRGLIRGLLALPVVGAAAKLAGETVRKIRRIFIRAEVVVVDYELTEEDKADIARFAAQPMGFSFTDPNTGEESRIEIVIGV